MGLVTFGEKNNVDDAVSCAGSSSEEWCLVAAMHPQALTSTAHDDCIDLPPKLVVAFLKAVRKHMVLDGATNRYHCTMRAMSGHLGR